MPRVFCLDIDNENLADLARRLLSAHLFIIFLGLIVGILEIIEYFGIRAARARVSIQESSEEPGSRALLNATAIVIVYTLLPLICPTFIFCLARSGIRSSQYPILKGICLLDGAFVCATGCRVIAGIQASILYGTMVVMARDTDCIKDPPTGLSPEDCARAKGVLVAEYGIARGIAIVTTIVTICEAGACCVGMFSANEASTALSRNLVFCDAPHFPTTVMATGQPGVIMGIGQPVSPSAVQMGAPVPWQPPPPGQRPGEPDEYAGGASGRRG